MRRRGGCSRQLERDVGELGETEPTAVASDREPDGGVGAVPGSRDAVATGTLGAVVVLEEERQAGIGFGQMP